MDRFTELCERVRKGMRRLGVPGASLGVYHKGRERFACFGRTSVENPLPVDEDTMFQVGSITKTMTATVLMRFAQSGELDLDRPLREILPGFRMADPEVTRKATTRHLLTHTGGWVGDYFDVFGDGDDALRRMVEKVGKLPQVTPLGKYWSYNNAGFNIASRILELVSGLPYEAAVREGLFAPLGLTRSFFYPDDVMITHRFAAGHERRGGKVVVARPWAIGRAGNGVGGAVCSIRDLLAYGEFHLRSGQDAAGKRVMRRATIERMRKPEVDAGGRGKMGLSWFIRDLGGLVACGHGGATHGQEAALHFMPGEDFAVALLANSGKGGILTDALLGWAAELWFGAAMAKPAPIEATRELVEAAAGRYDLPISAFELKPRKGGLSLIDLPRGGFPTPATPPGEADPPVRAVFCEGDRLLMLDEPRKGSVAEFFRGPDGSVAFCRLGGRIHPKVS